MEGKVLHIETVGGGYEGVIKAEDGKRYKFSDAEIKSENKPKLGASVDFEPSNDKALQIYLLKQENNLSDISDNVSEKLTSFSQSQSGSQLTALFTGGMHNTLGVAAAFLALVSLFLPFIRVPNGFFDISLNLTDGLLGTILVILLIITALFYYGGVSKKYIKILTITIFILFITQFVTLLTDFFDTMSGFSGRDFNPLMFIRMGGILAIFSLVFMLFTAFVKKYKTNENTF